MYDNLFSSVDLINKGMQVTWLRNEVISHNIANVDTVGYKAAEVEFENIFSDALGTMPDGELNVTNEMHISGRTGRLAVSNPRHISHAASDISGVQPALVADDVSIRYDENDVDIEHEMIELAKNSVEYYTLVSKVNSEFGKLKTAINVE